MSQRQWYARYQKTSQGLLLKALYGELKDALKEEGIIWPADLLVDASSSQMQVWPRICQAWFIQRITHEGWRQIAQPTHPWQVYEYCAPGTGEDGPLRITLAARSRGRDAWSILVSAMRSYAAIHDMASSEQVAVQCLFRATTRPQE